VVEYLPSTYEALGPIPSTQTWGGIDNKGGIRVRERERE
jgi:hypothetical protein